MFFFVVFGCFLVFFLFFFARLSSNPESKAHFRKQKKQWYVFFWLFSVFLFFEVFFLVFFLVVFCFFSGFWFLEVFF